jgi:FdhE protein
VADRLAKFFGSQTPAQAEVSTALAQLTQLAAAHPDVQPAAHLQGALIRALYAAPAPITTPALTDEDLTARLAAGVPLLRHATPPCAARALQAMFRRLCDAARANTSGDSPSYATLARAVRQGQLDLWALSTALLAGHADTLPAQLLEQGYAADMAMTLLRLALLPFLEQVATPYAAWYTAQRWPHGYCPTCGAWPVLAEQRGLEQWRYLRCGLCASAWEVERLVCPFCTTREHTQLGYLSVEGEEQKQRVLTCNACQGYLKLRSTLTPLTTPQLLAEEVALVHLDLLAMAQGYGAPL